MAAVDQELYFKKREKIQAGLAGVILMYKYIYTIGNRVKMMNILLIPINVFKR